jgi:hypothetical protein
VGDVRWYRLLLLPVVRRDAGAVRGDAGAGCGLSLGFRLLNLYAPYTASLFGRAADAVEETEAFERFAGSWAPARVGPLDRDRTAGAAGTTLPPGERSKRSANALTLFVTCGEERVGVTEAAGPETERGVVFEGGLTAPFAVGWRCRVAAMSAGAGASSCWAVVV